MRRQHFAVGVNIDTGADGLLEQHLQIFQVVTGNQNRFTCQRTDIDRRRLRMSVSIGFAFVQNGHHAKVHFADCHRVREQLAHVGRLRAQPRHQAMIFGVNGAIRLAQNMRVLHIRRCTFQAIQAQHTQAVNVITDLRFVTVERKLLCLLLQLAEIIAHQFQCGQRMVNGDFRIHQTAAGSQRFAIKNGFTGIADDTLRIEVYVGQRGEKGAGREAVDLFINDAIAACGQCPGR